MTNGLSSLVTALELHRRGLWPILLHPLGATIHGRDGPRVSKGKEPMRFAWGATRPTGAELKRLFGEHPDAGVGLVLGPGGGVIDIEEDGPDGAASLAKLFGGESSETLGWSSRRGPHRLYLWDDRLADIDPLRRAKLTLPGLPGLEFRFGQDKQAQSACPPSVGEDGVPRAWNGSDTVAPLPEAALAFLAAALAAPRHEANGAGGWAAPPPSDPATAWFRKALTNEAGKVATARESKRHETLLAAARTLGGYLHHGYLTEADVVDELTHAASRAGLPDHEVAETIRDGLGYGKAAPLPWPANLKHPTGPSNDGRKYEPEPWPPLRLGELPTSPEFPVHVFPPPLQTFCREVAATIQAPTEFVGAAMLAVAGAAVGQTVNLSLSRTWSEPPLLNVILVARPGTAKSPTIRAVCRPLTEIDRRLRQESSRAHAEWAAAKKAHEKDPDNEPPPGPEPPLRRAIVKDVTRESLVTILAANPRGVLCDPDEASGWVGSFNEYKGKGGSDRQFWLSVWGCAPVSVDRKGGRESIYVPHPFVGVVAGMPPAMLGSLSEERGREDGFLDRCLFVFPEPSAFPPQRWSRAELSQTAEQDWREAVGRLFAMTLTADAPSTGSVTAGDPDEPLRPFYARLTAEAEREWAGWFDSHGGETDAPDFPDDLAGAWSKMKAHLARFALILSRLRLAFDPTASPERAPIEACDVRGAVALVTYFKAQAERVRHEMTGGVGSTDAKAVLGWIRRNGRTTFREAEVSADLRRFRAAPRALAAALGSLRGAGVIRPRPEARSTGPGRTGTTVYDVHPEIARAPGNTGNTEKGPAEANAPHDSGIFGNSRRPASDAPNAAPHDSGIFGNSRRPASDAPNGREVIEL